MSSINKKIRKHYDSLLPGLENGYVNYRWKSHPLQRLHYLQTRLTLRRAFDRHVGQVGRMLEVGCGPGTWTDECLGHTEKLILLDISKEMIDEAREKYSRNDSVSLVCGDFTSGTIEQRNIFDAVISVRAIEYMDPKNVAIGQASQLLKPGGILTIITKNPGWRDAEENSGFDKAGSGGIHSDWISWKELSDLVSEQGMDVLEVRPAAMGSYKFPLSNIAGRYGCHLLHRLLVGMSVPPLFPGLTESYLLVARRKSCNG